LPEVAQVATRVAVMRAGQFVETGPVEEILQRPSRPYTQELLVAVPEIAATRGFASLGFSGTPGLRRKRKSGSELPHSKNCAEIYLAIRCNAG